MTNAAVYVRVSTVRQAEKDLSLPDQIAQCRNYCERQGWDVVDVFCEPGASALDDDRPVFQEMIYKATRTDKPFDYIVIHSLSRFSRDALHSELYVRKLRKAGVELISITQNITPDANGEIFRKLLNVFDEHQSRENAKHVHRAMCENARQGFWNGARPPFGYKAEVTGQRGGKEKKVLVIDEQEAKIVRQIYEMASGQKGRPLGLKAIASHFNERGILRRGRKFSKGGIHDVLTSPTYFGRHYFNRNNNRNQTARPPSEWIELSVPPIIDETTFNKVQSLLKSRSPLQTPTRVTNGPTLLAGLVRCAHCGAALIKNTGKSGAYRYYCCSKKQKEGVTSCQGIRIPMDKLDGIVIDELSKRIIQPERLNIMLHDFVRASADQNNSARSRLSELRHQLKEAENGLARLLELIEKGLMHPDDPALKDRLISLKLRRNEAGQALADYQKRLSTKEPEITPEKIQRVANILKDKLYNGSPDLRQAYARLLINDVTVSEQEIRISGSKTALARFVSGSQSLDAPEVLSFDRDWWAGRDSNPQPSRYERPALTN
jgi:site-specific DNA recombinase